MQVSGHFDYDTGIHYRHFPYTCKKAVSFLMISFQKESQYPFLSFRKESSNNDNMIIMTFREEIFGFPRNAIFL